jgi:aryl-alcohol dehydrogenase-like predicted oxidoreductase
VIQLAVRWMLDQGISVALWGGRHPDQLHAALGLTSWSLDSATRSRIDRILNTTITDPIGPDFIAPPTRS